ncbi:MAG TPA: isoprenylcysteine carboxylmethyltransferase family protein [Terriglobales bacterium]|nr:isoprenylcysteine carboxylmethyltransferase family protein [Terriglobales bacterium]
MTAQAAAALALLAYLVFLGLAFGLRTLVHYRRTGSSGFVGLSGAPGSAEWCGGVLFAAAMLAGLAAPLLQLAGVVSAAPVLTRPSLQLAGVVLYLLGVAGTLWAQFAMGESWRIGVDPAARTALVAAGPFRWVRNPIFTAMSLATLGLALLVPNVFALLSLLALILALEVQVRLVEEPYLARTHGHVYRSYAATAGRFLPGLGRMEEP